MEGLKRRPWRSGGQGRASSLGMWLARAAPPWHLAGRRPCSVALLRFMSHQSGCPEFSALPAKAPGREASLCGRSRLAPRRGWGGVFPWLKSSPCHPEAKPQLCCWAGTGTCPEPGGGCSGSHSSLVPPLLSAHSIPISQMRQRRLPSPGHALGQQARPGARSPARQARLVPRSLGAWKPEKPDSLCARCPGDARGPACWSQCQPLSGPLAPPPARHGSGHQAGGLWGRLQDSILDQAGKKPWVLRAWTQGLDVDSTCKEGA